MHFPLFFPTLQTCQVLCKCYNNSAVQTFSVHPPGFGRDGTCAHAQTLSTGNFKTLVFIFPGLSAPPATERVFHSNFYSNVSLGSPVAVKHGDSWRVFKMFPFKGFLFGKSEDVILYLELYHKFIYLYKSVQMFPRVLSNLN